MFGWLVAQIAALLRFLYELTGSYGWAIIALTLVVKLVLHPLTRRQLRSMKEMQKLQPHLQALQRKFKDDPQRLNKEIMDLYRAHGVNPFGGCLPMLLQMPVLFALYRVLSDPSHFVSRSGQVLKSVPFGPWDLLVHPMTVLSDPGKYGWAAVVAYAAVPVLVGASTYLQQKVSVTDPQQARMFVFMPFLVGWFSLNFAVGLSLYWFASTLAYVGEYLSVVGLPKRQPAEARARRRSGAKAAEVERA
ncbi:MAG: YidC/Oxa1 family membrane protein insertase [Armatimonadota bacterium]|nr:YidC/Oxa1 family membrane protein insertase [Armatimonadota bacterium]MDW8155650.1 YidC/Oxa1 family membrane protein insertase [Armatimonadota bacterium]